MISEQLLEKLKLAENINQKAFIVADAIFDDLPALTAKIAKKCLCLLWFDDEIIRELAAGEPETNLSEIFQSLGELSFVEKGPLPKTYTFHKATRDGFLDWVSKKGGQEFFSETHLQVSNLLLSNWENDEYAIAAIYGLIAAQEKDKAEEKLNDLIIRFQTSISKSINLVNLVDELINLFPFDDDFFSAEIQIFFGRTHVIQGKLEEALVNSKLAQLIDPQNPGAYLIQADIYSAKLMLKEAAKAFEQAIKLDKSPISYVARGNFFLLNENLKKAEIDFKNALKIDPQNIYAIIGRANIFETTNKYGRAIAEYNKAIKIQPNDIFALTLRAIAYIKKEDYDSAIADYLQILTTNPDTFIAKLGIARAFGKKGKKEEAFKQIDEVLISEPNNIIALHTRGSLFLEHEDYIKAINDFQKIISTEPNYSAVYEDLFFAYKRASLYSEAINVLEKAIEHSTNLPGYYINLVPEARDLREFRLGKLALSKLLTLSPNNSMAYTWLGYFNLLEDDLTKADYHLNRALRFSDASNRSIALLNLGILLRRIGDVYQSAITLNKALRLDARLGKKADYLTYFTNYILGNIEALQKLEQLMPDLDTSEIFDLLDWSSVLLRSTDPIEGLEEFHKQLQKELDM